MDTKLVIGALLLTLGVATFAKIYPAQANTVYEISETVHSDMKEFKDAITK